MIRGCLPRRFAWAYAAIAVAFLAWAAAFIASTSLVGVDGQRYFSLFDDAMISMRYALNFVQGNGLVWNPGEYVQGYTNVLQTLIMSLFILLFGKVSGVLAVQIFGALVVLAAAAIAARIAARVCTPDSPAVPLVFLLALLYYPLNYWGLMGMETALVALCLVAALWFALAFVEGRRRDALALSLCIAAGFLARPDTLLLASPMLALALAAPGRRSPRDYLALFVPLLFIVGGCLLFQRVYYGDWLPNTYTLKMTGMPLLPRLENGLGFIRRYLVEHCLLLAVLVAVAALLRTRLAAAALAVVVLSLVYQVYVGGDAWDYWRMLAPAWPLACVLLGLAAHATRQSALARRLGNTFAPLAGGFMLALVLSAEARFADEFLLRELPFQVGDNVNNVNRALVINHVTSPQASLAVFWAGAMPYYAERRAIDALGKSDRYVARLPPDMSGTVADVGVNSLPGHNKYDLRYSITQLEPTFAEKLEWGRESLAAERDNYVHVVVPGVEFDFYLRKNSPDVLWDRLPRGGQ